MRGTHRARFTTTTEVYPDSPRTTAERCNEAQHPMEWGDLQVLLALLRTGTYKGAAAPARPSADGSTPSRPRLGCGCSIAPPAAERLMPLAEQVERATAEVVRTVESLESRPEGVVRLTAPPGLVDVFVAPRLPALVRRFPALRLELEASVSYSDLTRGEADLALRTMRPQTGDLVSVRVAEEPDVLLASPKRVRGWGALSGFDGVPVITYGDALRLCRVSELPHQTEH